MPPANGHMPINVWTNTGLRYVGGRRWVVGVRIWTRRAMLPLAGDEKRGETGQDRVIRFDGRFDAMIPTRRRA
jgi:hypothetical protein